MILQKLLQPFMTLLRPIVSHVKTIGGGGGSRPAKEALKAVAAGQAAAEARRKAIAANKARRLAQLRTRERGVPLAGARSASARATLRRP